MGRTATFTGPARPTCEVIRIVSYASVYIVTNTQYKELICWSVVSGGKFAPSS